MDTKTKILDAAEILFAESGFAQTSMRQITAKADVNLAAVNYHFGNKNNLIQAALKRYFDCFMPALEQSLHATASDASVMQILTACVGPLQSLDKLRNHGCALFLLLLGRGYNETQGHLRRFIQHEYGMVLNKLIASLHASVPWISSETLFWRLHFSLGSLVFTIAAQTALAEIVQADFKHATTTEDMLEQLLPFIAQGISAQ